jgi:putative YhbY family RNA-binding protein
MLHHPGFTGLATLHKGTIAPSLNEGIFIMVELTPAQRRALKAQAHSLHPVVAVAGNGLSPSVLAEIDRSLRAHDLIKVRVYGADRDQRTAFMTEICQALSCHPVQMIGNLLVLWREPMADPVASEKPIKPAPRSSAKPARQPSRNERDAYGRRTTVGTTTTEKKRHFFKGPGQSTGNALAPRRRSVLGGYRIEAPRGSKNR